MPRKQKKHHYIYKTTCQVTGKFYVGMHSTDNLEDGYIGSGKILGYSRKKYGDENHVKEILEYCSSRDELRNREKEIVNEELLADPLNINLKYGGEGGSSGLSQATKNKISLSNKGKGHKHWTHESRKKLADYRTGKKHSAEAKTKVAAAHTGRILSNETKNKISESIKKVFRDPVKRQQRRLNITGRSFYNDGINVILAFPSDIRLIDPKWVKGKNVKV